MLSRQIRQRKEYLYKKAQEAQQNATYDRKRKVKEALETGGSLPTEVRADADKIRAELELEDSSRGAPSDGIDNEYANAGVADPKVLVTTSHDPSSKLTQFLKEVKLLIPNSHRMNRGGNTVQQIVETCRADGFTDLVVLQVRLRVRTHVPLRPSSRLRALGSPASSSLACGRSTAACPMASSSRTCRTGRRPTLGCITW